MQAIVKVPSSIAFRSRLLLSECHKCNNLKLSNGCFASERLLSTSLIGAYPLQRHVDSKWRFTGLPDLVVCNNRHDILVRTISSSKFLYDKDPLKPSSKVEETVNAIKNKKGEANKSSAVDEVKPKKPPLLTRVWHELVHYYHGFRLLFIDINVSRRLIWRVLNGKSLSRREHKLLVRTVGDVFRLLPFSVFIIVPFMELLLPLAIKLFPGMLPSTFQTATERDDKLKQSLKVRLEMAKFLQNTLDDMSVQSKDKDAQSAKEFTEFFRKVRTSGDVATTDEILKFSKLFEDEITLDSLSRPQLTALCRVLDINPVGMSQLLRFQIRMKLRSLAADDKMIQKEGVDSLTVPELQAACQSRAMRAYGVSEEKLRSQLSQWLDLSLNEKVPPSLLLLSRALMLPETTPATDQLKATISALPETLELKAAAAISEREGVLDNKTKIKLIKEEEEKIKEERAELREERQKATADKKEQLLDKAPILDASKTEQIKDELSTQDLEALEDALDTLGKEKKQLIVEKEELDDLKEELQEYKEDVDELNEVMVSTENKEKVQETRAAKNLFKKVNSMISKMDIVLADLEKKGQKLTESEEVKTDEVIRIDELMAIIKRIQKVPDDAKLDQISTVLGRIDDDHDGAISVEEVLKVIELIGKENVKITSKQLDEIIQLLEKEELLELEGQIEKALEKQFALGKEPASHTKDKRESSSESCSNIGKKTLKTSAMSASFNGTPAKINDPKNPNNGGTKKL